MSTKKQGFLQALCVAVYCLGVGVFFGQANKFIPGPDTALTPVIFLLLFSASALICGLIVFYKPYKLFFAGHKNEAIETVMFTAVSLFAFAVLGLIGLVVFR